MIQAGSDSASLWRGLFLALASAVAYSSSFVLSANALDESMSPLTMTLCRFAAVVVVLGIWLLRTRGFIPLYSKLSLLSAGIGVFHFSANFAMMVALTLAPVSVAIVTFYMFPAVVLLFTCALERRMPTLVQVVTIVLAITGVALTVGSGDVQMPIAGVVLALGGAVCVSIMMMGTQRLLVGVSSIALTFNLAVAATALALVLSAVSGSLAFPSTSEGWLTLGAIVLLYPFALTCAVLAIGAAGAVTVALVLCIEPVLTVLMAVWFRGESLTSTQVMGVALVVGAVVFMQIIRARNAKRAAAGG